MTTSLKTLAGALMFGAFALTGSTGAFAQAAVMKECGAEWQAAKAANQTQGKTWNEFLAGCRVRHQQPANAATPAQPAAQQPAQPAAQQPANPLQPRVVRPAPAPAPSAAAPAAAGAAVFPTAVDPEFASLAAGKQRLKTCSKQYQANKANNGNGDMKWIEKGGGYWSMCNKKLKGEL